MKRLLYFICGIMLLIVYLCFCIPLLPKTVDIKWNIYFVILSIASMYGWWFFEKFNAKKTMLIIFFTPIVGSMIGYSVIYFMPNISEGKYHFSICSYLSGWIMLFIFSNVWILSVLLTIIWFIYKHGNPRN